MNKSTLSRLKGENTLFERDPLIIKERDYYGECVTNYVYLGVISLFLFSLMVVVLLMGWFRAL